MAEPRTPLEIARQKVVDADQALARLSNAEDYTATGAVVAPGLVLGGAALTAAGVTAPVGAAAVAAGVAGGGAYVNARGSTDTAIATAKEARRAYNDEARKVGSPEMNVDEVDYMARPFQTDPTRAWNESVQPVVDDAVKGAGELYDSATETLSEAFDSVLGDDEAAATGSVGSVMEVSPEAVDTLVDTAESAYDSVVETASETYDDLTATVGNAYNEAAETISGGYATAAEAVESTYESVAGPASEAYDAASEAWDSVDLNPFE